MVDLRGRERTHFAILIERVDLWFIPRDFCLRMLVFMHRAKGVTELMSHDDFEVWMIRFYAKIHGSVVRMNQQRVGAEH